MKIQNEMENITLHNGTEKRFEVSAENDTYKFYRCETYNDAVSLQMTLTDIGNVCSLGEDSRGWFVRVKNVKRLA